MSTKSVINRLNATGKIHAWLTEPYDPTPRRPDRDVIAFIVAWCRDAKQLPVDVLASLADVSASSIERVERGERVTDETLNRVAVALGYEVGSFTDVRAPLTREEAIKKTQIELSVFEETTQVPVAPLKKHRQVRELSKCDSMLIDVSMLCEAAQDAAAPLHEWFDFLGFERLVCDGIINAGRGAPAKMRLWTEAVLENIREVEAQGKAVALAGCYEAEITWMGEHESKSWQVVRKGMVGIIRFFPRSTDPYAVRRKFLMAAKSPCVHVEPE